MSSDDNYIYWNKADISPLSKHFHSNEFSCHCRNDDCVRQKASLSLLSSLEAIRESLATPVTITSGYRCAKYQKELADLGHETAKGISQHELGNAADLSTPHMHELLIECKKRFLAVGTARSFIHVDTRADKERYWSYTSS